MYTPAYNRKSSYLIIAVLFVIAGIIACSKKMQKPPGEVADSPATTVLTISETGVENYILRPMAYTYDEKKLAFSIAFYDFPANFSLTCNSVSEADAYIKLLETSAKTGRLINAQTDLQELRIYSMKAATSLETETYLKLRQYADAKEKDTNSLPAVIPNRQVLDSIFRMIVKQQCPGEVLAFPPWCINFKYSDNCCSDRAHWMRKIIEELFRYKTEKMFVIVCKSSNPIRIRIDGCKVHWEYHVAPVVTVDENGIPVRYIIDPSLFPEPVPVKKWLDRLRDSTGGNNPIFDTVTTPSRYYEPGAILPGECLPVKYDTDDDYKKTKEFLDKTKSLQNRNCN